MKLAPKKVVWHWQVQWVWISYNSLKYLVEKDIKDLQLWLKEELILITSEQIAFRNEFWTITEELVDQLLIMGYKTSHLKRSHFSNCSKMESLEEVANDFGTFRRNFNKLTEARSEIGSEADLRFTNVADWLERMEVYMATVLGSIQTSNTRGFFQKARIIKAVRL